MNADLHISVVSRKKSQQGKIMRIIPYLLCVICTLCSHAAPAHEQQYPDCSRPDGWAASAVGTRLKDLHLSDRAGGYDSVDVELLASEALFSGPSDRGIFRQVHKVRIRDGENSFTAITVNDASFQECSESGVDVYFISIECPADGPCRSDASPSR